MTYLTFIYSTALCRVGVFTFKSLRLLELNFQNWAQTSVRVLVSHLWLQVQEVDNDIFLEKRACCANTLAKLLRGAISVSVCWKRKSSKYFQVIT